MPSARVEPEWLKELPYHVEAGPPEPAKQLLSAVRNEKQPDSDPNKRLCEGRESVGYRSENGDNRLGRAKGCDRHENLLGCWTGRVFHPVCYGHN
jgi:hypothetical protein